MTEIQNSKPVLCFGHCILEFGFHKSFLLNHPITPEPSPKNKDPLSSLWDGSRPLRGFFTSLNKPLLNYQGRSNQHGDNKHADGQNA